MGHDRTVTVAHPPGPAIYNPPPAAPVTPHPPTPPKPAAPVLQVRADIHGVAVVQRSLSPPSKPNTGGLIRLYAIQRPFGGHVLFQEQPWTANMDWLPFLGNSFTGFASEVGNGVDYAGESDPSATVNYVAP